MAKLDAASVAALLTELGQRIELSGDSPYKARAYHRAAESLRALAEPLDEVVAGERLRDIPGVGAALEAKIAALHRTGTDRTLERLRAEVPATALEILRIPGLRSARARHIVGDLKIHSLPELAEAAGSGRLAEIKGLGPAAAQAILRGIDMLGRAEGQRLIHHAGSLLEAMVGNLEAARPELRRIVPAGDFRRGCEHVSTLAVVAEADEVGKEIASVEIGGEVEVLVAPRPLYGVAVILATGSAEHVAQLQARAASMGMTLDRDGLRRGRQRIPCSDEEDVYAALDLPLIPPELREGVDEIEQAAAGRLPELVDAGDIRGVVHCHTDSSDGTASLEVMAEAARERGYGYFGVADHSVSAGYAGGLTIDEIERQHAEADALNRRYRGRFRIFKGIESDILADGSLDYPDEVLQRFDFVVASIHSRFRMSEEEQTERVLRAVANPRTTILGHMTGRLLLRRDGYELDVAQVLAACAEHGVVVEINVNPHRLDFDWRWHRMALDLGCMLAINPDAHSTDELDLMRWGIAVARKGGVPPDRVLNCLTRAKIDAWFRKRKAAAG